MPKESEHELEVDDNDRREKGLGVNNMMATPIFFLLPQAHPFVRALIIIIIIIFLYC